MKGYIEFQVTVQGVCICVHVCSIWKWLIFKNLINLFLQGNRGFSMISGIVTESRNTNT